MAKPGKKKKSCEKYKQENHLEKNKEKKKERNERRIEKFRKRREEKEKREVLVDFTDSLPYESNVGSTQARHTEYSRLRSIFAKLHKEIMKEKMELAKKEFEIKKIEKDSTEYFNS